MWSMQIGCHGWPSPQEPWLFLDSGQDRTIVYTPPTPLEKKKKFLRIQRTGSRLMFKNKPKTAVSHQLTPEPRGECWSGLAWIEISVCAFKGRNIMSHVPGGWGWGQCKSHPATPPLRDNLWWRGYLVAIGGMRRVQGGIPFPLNNLPCQCGPNRAAFFFFLQGWVLSLFHQRESLSIVSRSNSSVKMFCGMEYSVITVLQSGGCHGF